MEWRLRRTADSTAGHRYSLEVDGAQPVHRTASLREHGN